MMHLRGLRAVAFAVAVVVLATAFPTPAKADISFGFSYSTLSPHGSWLVSGQYGRVWRPREAFVADWNPYYDGHWVYTDLGWTWVSDYSWGSIPYHYGTWVIEPGIGWVWLPGEVWAPSWVVFCNGPDYIGWAPVPPHYSVGVSVSFGDIGYDRFVVVPTHDFLAPRVRSYMVPRSRTQVIINNTKIVNRISVQNNVVINNGPDVNVVERATHKRIERVPIERVHKVTPGQHVDREQLRFDRSKEGGRPKAVEPVSTRTRPSIDDKGRVEERQGGNRRQDSTSAARQQYQRDKQRQEQQQQAAPTQRRQQQPDSTSAARQQYQRDKQRQEQQRQQAAPAQRRQQQPDSTSAARQQYQRDKQRQEQQRQQAAPTQRRQQRPDSTSSARQQYRSDRRKQMPSAAPAKKRAPVKQQQPPAKKKRTKPTSNNEKS